LRNVAGPPCRGVYKYGGLALQVGGWATGRQPVTINKGNLNCSLRTVGLSGIELGSGKRVNEMRIGTWNVCMLYRAGAMNELVKETEKYKIDVHDFI